jgi:hypothetical protein
MPRSQKPQEPRYRKPKSPNARLSAEDIRVDRYSLEFHFLPPHQCFLNDTVSLSSPTYLAGIERPIQHLF